MAHFDPFRGPRPKKTSPDLRKPSLIWSIGTPNPVVWTPNQLIGTFEVAEMASIPMIGTSDLEIETLDLEI